MAAELGKVCIPVSQQVGRQAQLGRRLGYIWETDWDTELAQLKPLLIYSGSLVSHVSQLSIGHRRCFGTERERHHAGTGGQRRTQPPGRRGGIS